VPREKTAESTAITVARSPSLSLFYEVRESPPPQIALAT